MTIRPPFKSVEASRPDFDVGYQHHYTKTPQPDWKYGGGLNDLPESEHFKPENAEWRVIDPADCEKPALYKLMIGAITPRPIAFMSTMSSSGVCNLSPMSYFNMVSHAPPTIMISIQSSPKNANGLKDTTTNILETKEFCCSIISETFVEAANCTAVDAPGDVEEWDLSGLTKRGSLVVKPPHVAEAAVSMECELVHTYEVRRDDGGLSNTVVFGRVKRFHLKEFILDPNDPMKVLPEKLRAVSRLGGVTYGRTLQMSELPRPDWNSIKDDADVQAVLGESDTKGNGTS